MKEHGQRDLSLDEEFSSSSLQQCYSLKAMSKETNKKDVVIILKCSQRSSKSHPEKFERHTET